MKNLDKQIILAVFTFIALVIILLIQINWLFNAAKLEEKEFNLTIAKALNEARDEIGKRVPQCNNMKNYLCGHPCHENIQEQTVKEIDSIIHSKLHNHQIALEYKFEITDSINAKSDSKLFGQKCYLQSLNGLLEKNGIQIKLEFPERKQFLVNQMKGTFLLAFFAVIFVMISFIITFKLFNRERRQLRHTSDFINNMVHEFQTPLSNIRLAANLIKKRGSKTDEKIFEYTNVIIKENEKLENHVKNILEVSNNGENSTLIEKVNMHNIIFETGKEFKTRLEGLNGNIEYHLNAKNYIISALPSHFTLIFSNLIDNALKYSKEPPSIIISTINRKNNIEVCVKDNGVGIDTKDLPKIFDKYFRVSTGDVHNVKGFGLGLTYVKKIIDHYKGKIEVLSSKDSGTLFTITLPLENEKN